MTQLAPRPAGYAYVTQHELYFTEGTPLPPVCLKCGMGGCATVDREVEHAPTWLTAVALFMLPLAYVIYFVIRERRRLHVPVCSVCARRLDWRRRLFPMACIAAVTALVLPLAGMVYLGTTSEAFDGSMGYWAGLIYLPLFLVPPLSFMPLISRTTGFRMGAPPRAHLGQWGWPPVEVVCLVGVHPSALGAFRGAAAPPRY